MVTGYACEVTEKGPLFVDARIRYSFDNGGFYQMTARVLAGDPAARIDEQFDMGRLGSGYTWRLVISLSSAWQERGWKPDHVFWQVPEGRVQGREEALEARLAGLGFDVKPFQDRSFGSRKLSYDEPFAKVFDMAVWYPWHPAVHYFGLVNGRTLAPEAAQRDRIDVLSRAHRGPHGRSGTVSLPDSSGRSGQAADAGHGWPDLCAGHCREQDNSAGYRRGARL